MPRQAAAAAGFATNGSTRALLKPPPDLDAVEKETFLDLVMNAPPSHFIPSDAPLLGCYAKALIQERVSAGELRASGYVSADGKPSAWLAVWQASIRATTTLARMLALSPGGRVPSKAPDDDKHGPANYYSRLAMEQKRDEPN